MCILWQHLKIFALFRQCFVMTKERGGEEGKRGARRERETNRERERERDRQTDRDRRQRQRETERE